MKDSKTSLISWSIFVLLALTWGSSFILMKYGLQSFDYGQIGMLRIALAFWFTALISVRSFKRLNRQNWFPLMVVGLLGNGIPYVLFPLAITELDSSIVGILNSMVPLFTLLIGVIWFRTKVGLPSVFGIVLGLAGAIWLLLPDMKFDVHKISYGLYPVIATICYAISINTIHKKLTDLDSMSITLLSLMFVGIPATIYMAFTNFGEVMQTDPKAWTSFGYVALLGIVGSSLAIAAFNYLIKETSSLFAASVTYLIPVVALLWGVADGESVGPESFGGMLAILIGVYLVNRRRRLNKA